MGAAGGVEASGVAGIAAPAGGAGEVGVVAPAGGAGGVDVVFCAMAALLSASADAKRIIFILVPPTVVGE